MKIFIICSKYFYEKIPEIKEELESRGHIITLPNSYDNPFYEMDMKKGDEKEYRKWKKQMFERSINEIKKIDAVLVLNFEKKVQSLSSRRSVPFFLRKSKKNGIKNYIGGATFLEIYDAWRENKKIFFYNEIPKGILYDELHGFDPVVINGELDLIK